MTLNKLFLAATTATTIAAAGAAILTIQPGAGHAYGVTTDVERQACRLAKTRAMRANRQARAGEISPQERRDHWIRYRDCLGSKEKNHLLPTEFKYK